MTDNLIAILAGIAMVLAIGGLSLFLETRFPARSGTDQSWKDDIWKAGTPWRRDGGTEAVALRALNRLTTRPTAKN